MRYFKYGLLFLLLFILSILQTCSAGAQKAPVAIQFPEHFKISGDLADRMALTERRLAGHPFSPELVVEDVARLEGHQRRFEDYEGDVSGRVLGSWSYAARLLQQRPAKLDTIAEQILTFQNPDGSFGRHQKSEGWDEWGRQLFGHGRLLMGLLEYYRLSGNDRYLQAAEKLGDYIAGTIPDWTTAIPGNPWDPDRDRSNFRNRFIKTHQTSVMEGLVTLSEVSGQRKYLQAAQEIVPLFPAFGFYHSHSYMNSMVGISKIYLQTGDNQYRKKVTDIYWREIRTKVDQPDGGTSEYFPNNRRTEGCSVVDWLRLNLHLWAMSGNGTYMDEAENTWMNGLNFHQTQDGAFGHATRTDRGYDSPYSESWWCCTMHGLFAYDDILKYSTVVRNQDVWINLFTPLETSVSVEGVPVAVRMETTYPADGNITIHISPEQQKAFGVRIRIPGWATANFQLAVNGSTVATNPSDGYVSLDRTWQPNDVVTLSLPMGIRYEDDRGNTITGNSRLYDTFRSALVYRGPLILAADLRQNPGLPDTLFIDSQHAPQVKAAQSSGVQLFSVPEAHVTLPARMNGRRRDAVLVPLAEQTGYGTWSDRLPTFQRNGEKPIQRVPVRFKFVMQFLH